MVIFYLSISSNPCYNFKMKIEQDLNSASSKTIITNKLVQELPPNQIINTEDEYLKISGKVKIKDPLMFVIGVVLSLFLGFVAFMYLASTISEAAEIKENIIRYILLALILIFILFIIIKSLVNSDFKQKIKTQMFDTDYFSFVSVFLAIIGISISGMFLLPNQGAAIIVAPMGIPILFIAGLMARSIYKAKNRTSLNKSLSIITFVIIGLFIIALLIAPVVEISRENYYAKKGETLKKENTPVCSSDFMESYNKSLSVGDYNFCMDAFREYNYTVDIPIKKNAYFVVEGCKINNDMVNRDSCISKMSSSFGDTVPYCEEQKKCDDKFRCYHELGRGNYYDLIAINKNVDGSTCAK